MPSPLYLVLKSNAFTVGNPLGNRPALAVTVVVVSLPAFLLKAAHSGTQGATKANRFHTSQMHPHTSEVVHHPTAPESIAL